MALTTRIVSTFDATQTSPGDLGSAAFPANSTFTTFWSSGTASGQADRMWTDTRTITASSTDSLDLSGAALLDPYGAAVVYVKLKYIRVQAAAANVNNVQVAVPASNGVLWASASTTINVKPGGLFEWVDPVGQTVTAATADLLNIINGGAGTSVVYDVVLIGTSA